MSFCPEADLSDQECIKALLGNIQNLTVQMSNTF